MPLALHRGTQQFEYSEHIHIHIHIPILQRVRAGEVLMCFLYKIAILKCFFFNLLLRFFVGALGDWRQAICRHYFSASAFLH